MKLFNKKKYKNASEKYEWKKDLVSFKKYYYDTRYGYEPNIEFDKIENLISMIIYWYEMKESDRKYDLEKGISNIKFDNIEDISSFLTIDQLRFRLSTKELRTIDCEYRGSGGYSVPIGGTYNNDGILSNVQYYEEYLAFYLKDNNQKNNNETFDITVSVNKKTGMVKSLDGLEDYIDLSKIDKEISVYDLYSMVYNIKKLDIKELERVIYYHQLDSGFRNKLLEIIIEGLMTSKNTTPEYGIKRAKVFIEEFSNYYNCSIKIPEKRKIKSRL